MGQPPTLQKSLNALQRQTKFCSSFFKLRKNMGANKCDSKQSSIKINQHQLLLT